MYINTHLVDFWFLVCYFAPHNLLFIEETEKGRRRGGEKGKDLWQACWTFVSLFFVTPGSEANVITMKLTFICFGIAWLTFCVAYFTELQ